MATYDSLSVIKHLATETRMTFFACVKDQLAQPNASFEFRELEQMKDDCEELSKRWNACLSIEYTDRQVYSCINRLHDVMQTLQNIKESSCDSGLLAQQLADGAEQVIELGDKFMDKNRYEQGAFIYQNFRTFWERWSNLVIAQGCSQKRMCIRYPGLPKKNPTVAQEDMVKIENALVSFFKEQKNCRSCKIANYIRTYDYFYFATLQEKTQVLEVDDPNTNTFEPTRVQLPFKLIFSYNEDEGVFSLYGKVDPMQSKELAELLVGLLVGYTEPLEREPKPTYNLSKLKDKHFAFPTDPSDGIAEVFTRGLTIRPIDAQDAEITYKNRTTDAHQTIQEFANMRRLTPDNIEVTRAILYFRMAPDFTAFRHVSLELSLTSDDLPSKTEAQNKMLKKYLMKWGFLENDEQRALTLVDVLINFSSAQSPIMTNDYKEHLPSYIRCALWQWDFLKPAPNTHFIKSGGCENEISSVTNAEGTVDARIVGPSGILHEADEYDTQRYRIDYSPLAELLHTTLECKGSIEEKIDNKVWWIGNKGQEARDIYLVRNWDGFDDVQDFLKGQKDNSLIIYIGGRPGVVRIGNSSSENPETAGEIQVQYYSINGLVEYSIKDGFSVNAQPIWENIKTMFAKRPVRRRSKKPGAQSNAQEKVEDKLWKLGNGMMELAHMAEDGEELNVPQRKVLAVVFHTKGDFAKTCAVEAYELSRIQAAWENKDVSPYGSVYRGLFDILVPASKYKIDGDIVGSRIQQLNDLYHQYPQKIRALRDLR